MLECREALIIQTLMELPKDVVLIGGYAVNAYVLPRFSVDCDLVVFQGIMNIKKILVKNGFKQTEKGDVPHGEYFRFVREKEKVSFDLLLNSVFDRVTGIVFEGSLFKKHSKERVTVGRTNPVRIKIRTADAELLFAMKFVSDRRQDIRDIFMLSGTELNWNLIADIIKEKCSKKLLKERVKMIKAEIANKSYRDSLHGAFGKIPDKTFDRCNSKLVGFLNGLMSM